jgi:AcrR family transcriptional regulator
MVAAALRLIAAEGEAGLTTRAVCAATGVTAPTLYHHFGTLDGLLNAALARAFDDFLAGKAALKDEPDAIQRLERGWEDYVGFAARAPGLYAAMIGRVLKGVKIPAAEAARAILVDRVRAAGAIRPLGLSPEAAADMIWASAHAAAMLHVFPGVPPPDVGALARLRDASLAAIFLSD